MKPRGALILLGGELKNPAKVRALARSFAVVCADGGARHAAALGLTPRLIVGDMDSLPKRRPAWPETTFLCDFDPNSSDLEKTLSFLSRRGFTEAWIAGASGGRIDHALINVAIAEKYGGEIGIHLIHDEMTATLLAKGKYVFPGRKGSILSMLPVAAGARVSLSGTLYPLTRALLRRGSQGLSNRALGTRVRLQIHSGRLWLFR